MRLLKDLPGAIMAIGIRLTVDFVFKLVFGSPDHSRITIHFLNAILAGGPKIVHVTIRNPFLGKDFEDDKLSVLDILAEDEHGRLLNIEIQTTLPAGMNQRLAYYASALLVDQLTEGTDYSSLRSAISICVLTQPMFPKVPDLHLEFQLRTSTGLLLTDNLQVHLLELSKLSVTAENVSEASPIEQWAYFMLNADKLTLEDVKQTFSDREFTEAAGVLEMISQNPEQQMRYDARLKFQRDEAARLELVREEALREGEEKGIEKGIEKGRVEGESKGRREGELLGQIKLLQQLLGVPESTREELLSNDEARLKELSEELQRQLRTRGV